MKNTILTKMFLVLILSLFSLSLMAEEVRLRNDPFIGSSICSQSDSSMVIRYTRGVYGLDAYSTKVYVTFNGEAVGSSELRQARGEAPFSSAHISCAAFGSRHGIVKLYFVDDYNNRDDNFGYGWTFSI